jgi:hypothetical protein
MKFIVSAMSFLLLIGCTAPATPQEQARAAAIEQHNAQYFARKPGEAADVTIGSSQIDLKVKQVRIGMDEAAVYRIMGMPLRQNQITTEQGVQRQLVYAREQFTTAGEKMAQAIYQGAGGPPAAQGITTIILQNGRVTAIQRSQL